MTSIEETPEAATHRCCVAVLKNVAKVTGQHLRLTSFIIKLLPFSFKNTYKVPQHNCFSVNLAQIVWTVVLHHLHMAEWENHWEAKILSAKLNISHHFFFINDVKFLFSAFKCAKFWLLRRCLVVSVFSTLSQIRLMNSENYNETNVHLRWLNQCAICKLV